MRLTWVLLAMGGLFMLMGLVWPGLAIITLAVGANVALTWLNRGVPK